MKRITEWNESLPQVQIPQEQLVKQLAPIEIVALRSWLAIAAAVVLFTAWWWIGLIVLAAALPRLWVYFLYAQAVWGVENDIAEIRRKYWINRWILHNPENLVEIKLMQGERFFLNEVDPATAGVALDR